MAAKRRIQLSVLTARAFGTLRLAIALSAQRIQYLSRGNRKLMHKNRHIFLFVALFLGQLIMQPELMAAPILPIVQGTAINAPTWQAWLFYGCFCLGWLSAQGKLVAADNFVVWCQHLPVSPLLWCLTRVFVLVAAIGPLWLPWFIALSLTISHHQTPHLAASALSLLVFFTSAGVIVYKRSDLAGGIFLHIRRALPVVDLQVGVLYSRHRVAIAIRQCASFAIVVFAASLATRPDNVENRLGIMISAFTLVAIVASSAVPLLATAHAESAPYFAHLPFSQKRIQRGDAAAIVLLAAGPIVAACILCVVAVHLAATQILISACGAVLICTTSAWPPIGRSANGRLLHVLASIAIMTALANTVPACVVKY